MNTLTNKCPICGEKTYGSAVRNVLFCPAHRDIAVEVRDDPILIKKYKKNFPKASDFVDLVRQRDQQKV